MTREFLEGKTQAGMPHHACAGMVFIDMFNRETSSMSKRNGPSMMHA
jgi:hypothetical protein